MQKLTDEDRIQEEWNTCLAVTKFINTDHRKWIERHYPLHVKMARLHLSHLPQERPSDEMPSPLCNLIDASRLLRCDIVSYSGKMPNEEFGRFLAFEDAMFREVLPFRITESTRKCISELVNRGYIDDDELELTNEVTRDVVSQIRDGESRHGIIIKKEADKATVYCPQEMSLDVPYIEETTCRKCTVVSDRSVYDEVFAEREERVEKMKRAVDEVTHSL
jgi:hypothetical protein